MNYDLMTIWNNHSETVEDFIETIESTINAALVGTTVRHLLAASTDIDARELVATSTSTPVELLHLLSVDEDADVRIAVAMNESVTEDILIMLAHDEEEDVRAAVAGADTTADILRIMVDDDSDEVRRAVALNLNTDEETRLTMTTDSISGVRGNAAFNLRRNTPATRDALTRLSTDIGWVVRANVAGNKVTPKSVVEILANDEHEYVRGIAEKHLAVWDEASKR